ncbi:PIN domain-containing protein [Candidatus Micrarchaeota archaeon]|nr:PIN domain-containing protein [Candidatus Micrarchaeota archaeon]
MLFDTSVWVEYLAGTEAGKKARDILKQDGLVCTCPLTLAEISVWCHKNNKNPQLYIREVKALSKMLDLSEDILIASGRIYSEERKKNGKISLADSIIYACARFHDMELMTSDNDFRGLVGVKML